MDRFHITGPSTLHGTMRINGAKNAALPIMTTCLLTSKPVILDNIPDVADIRTMRILLNHLGIAIHSTQSVDNDVAPGSLTMTLTRTPQAKHQAPYNLVRRMRASALVLGALLGAQGRAEVSLPGGCAIGTRPMDIHLRALSAMGADIRLKRGHIIAKTPPEGLRGTSIDLAFPSVGATENIILAAVLAKGITHIKGCALEPEVGDLIACLQAMGADIEGIGQSTITIRGVKNLHGARHRIIDDRIEAGSYIAALAATGGTLTLNGFDLDLLGDKALQLFDALGVDITNSKGNDTTINVDSRRRRSWDITTGPFPEFPTDLQAQVTVPGCLGPGPSSVYETVFENRFMHIAELNRMGADIRLQSNRATIAGNSSLRGAEVMASDLRASFCLVIAGLSAKGQTIVHRPYHIDRGYTRLVRKLRNLGATIERLSE